MKVWDDLAEAVCPCGKAYRAGLERGAKTAYEGGPCWRYICGLRGLQGPSTLYFDTCKHYWQWTASFFSCQRNTNSLWTRCAFQRYLKQGWLNIPEFKTLLVLRKSANKAGFKDPDGKIQEARSRYLDLHNFDCTSARKAMSNIMQFSCDACRVWLS